MRHSPPRVRQGPAVSSTDDTDSWFNLFSLFCFSVYCRLSALTTGRRSEDIKFEVIIPIVLRSVGRVEMVHTCITSRHTSQRGFVFFPSEWRHVSVTPIQREKVHSCGWSDRPAQLEIVRSAHTVAPECPSLSECPWPKNTRGALLLRGCWSCSLFGGINNVLMRVVTSGHNIQLFSHGDNSEMSHLHYHYYRVVTNTPGWRSDSVTESVRLYSGGEKNMCAMQQSSKLDFQDITVV